MKNIEINQELVDLSYDELVNYNGGGLSEVGEWLIDKLATGYQTVANLIEALGEAHAKIVMYHNGHPAVLGNK